LRINAIVDDHVAVAYGKVKRLAADMNFTFISDSTYFRIHRLYLLPAVFEWWGWISGGVG
jgi:hypothetical protein